MGRTAKVSTRKANGAARPAGPDADQELDLTALRQTPGFMIRILQLQNFEAFYPYFESLKLSPLEYAILITVRDNKTVTQSELAAVLKMQLPNLVKILSRMEETGVLKRKRSTRDKRAVELSLSAAGDGAPTRPAGSARGSMRRRCPRSASPSKQPFSRCCRGWSKRTRTDFEATASQPAQPTHSAEESSSSVATAPARRVSTARWLI
jgi:hypothetical protein